MLFMGEVSSALVIILALNLWLTLGGLVVYFLDAEHVHDNDIIALLVMYFMFPIVIILSLIEGKDGGKSNSIDP